MAEAQATKPLTQEQQEQVEHITEQCHRALHGYGPEIQGAVLCDLVATHLAGHIVTGPDGEIARDRTNDLRSTMLTLHIKTVLNLIPVNEDMLLERARREAH